MHRLTLILSDLYVSDEAARESSLSDTLPMPNLEWLQRFAGGRVGRNDWRSWLTNQLGRGDLSRFAPAQLAASDLLPPAQRATSWFATPVHLEARLDHVRLSDRGLLRVAAEERAAWCAAFAQSFGPQLVLHEGSARGFLLSGLASTRVTTVDPARLIGADVGSALPAGPDAGPVRRLAAEIEMWLHGAPLNQLRERARLPRISALWLWGAGPGADLPLPEAKPRRNDLLFTGEDPFFAALSRTCTGANPVAVPESFSALTTSADHAIVELAGVSDGAAALARIDTSWFGPARTALSQGKLQLVDIVANERCYQIRSRAGWRFWRRHRHWIASLRA